jgi:hypothetical protein
MNFSITVENAGAKKRNIYYLNKFMVVVGDGLIYVNYYPVERTTKSKINTMQWSNKPRKRIIK